MTSTDLLLRSVKYIRLVAGFTALMSNEKLLPALIPGISSVPTLFEEEQLLSGGVVDVVGHDLRK